MTLPNPPITIVSGLPRSGTSLMMQMLVAGGIPALSDNIRTPDADNPRGYYEFERAKQIKADKAWLSDAQGKVVKMVHLLLLDLPMDRRYDIVFMRRDPQEVVKSQSVMLARSGKAGAALPPEKLIAVYAQQIAKVQAFLAQNACVRVLEVSYNDLIRDPASAARTISGFLQRPMNTDAMVGAVDPALYRNRSSK
jgi:hypothetical protein